MRYLAAVILACLATTAGAWDDDPQPKWQTDLDVACRIAAEEGKLILCRQILCKCDSENCEYLKVARRPWYLGDEKRRKMVEKNFIQVVLHTVPSKMRAPLPRPERTTTTWR